MGTLVRLPRTHSRYRGGEVSTAMPLQPPMQVKGTRGVAGEEGGRPLLHKCSNCPGLPLLPSCRVVPGVERVTGAMLVMRTQRAREVV